MKKYVLCLIGIVGFTNICNASWFSRPTTWFRRYNNECIYVLKDFNWAIGNLSQFAAWKKCLIGRLGITGFNTDLLTDDDLRRYFKRDCDKLGKDVLQKKDGKLLYVGEKKYESWLNVEDWVCMYEDPMEAESMEDESIHNWWEN